MSLHGVVIAHRAGNDLAAAAGASTHADVIEADVHLFRGRLEVRHAKTIGPLPILWERWYLLDRSTPRILLRDLLPVVGESVELMLDLKGVDPRLRAAVLLGVEEWLAAGRRLWISSGAWRMVDRLREVPGIATLHTAGSSRRLNALLRRYGAGSLDGVSVDHRILSPRIVSELLRRAPNVWSWPVNDLATAHRLEAWGVTGCITDAPSVLRPEGASPPVVIWSAHDPQTRRAP